MRHLGIVLVALYTLLLGARSKPMWRSPFGGESSSGGRRDGEGSSSGAQPSDPGFHWQENELQPPWTPLPQPWPADSSGAQPASSPIASQGALSDLTVIPATESQAAPVHHVTPQEWEENLQRALAMPNLVFTSVDKEYREGPRIYVAHNRHPSDWHPNIADASHEQPRTEQQRAHFASVVENVVKIKAKALPQGMPRWRTLVYLNSQDRMDYLNREYFRGAMQFLPINTAQLTWKLLNTLLTDREQYLLLAPRVRGELGLLVAMHRSGRMPAIETLTGALKNTQQVVTLWSPFLLDGTRTTVVFYGVGRLDTRDFERTLKHIGGLASRWSGLPPFWDAAYYLERLPKQFALGFYQDEHGVEDSEEQQRALERFESASRYLRSG